MTIDTRSDGLVNFTSSARSGTEAHQIGPKIGQKAYFLLSFCMIMLVKYVYDKKWIIIMMSGSWGWAF